MNIISGIKKIPKFFKEVRDELKKVSWSTRRELTGAAIIVVVVSAMLTIYVSIIDMGLSKLLQIFIK